MLRTSALTALIALYFAFLGSAAVRAAETTPAEARQNSSSETALPSKCRLHVYLLIGQSNMAGRGKMTAADRQPVDRVLKLDEHDRWAPAAHPLHFDKPAIAGVGLGLSFAEEIAKEDAAVVIGLVPCAVGGTRLKRWSKGGDLYEEALRRARIAARDGTLRGILWHQGEGDSGSRETADTYGRRLAEMIADLRSDLQMPELPFVVGRLGEFFVAGRDTEAVRTVDEALKTIAGRVPRAACASAEGLKHKGDGVHFSAEALRRFGRRYADQMKKLQSQ